MNITSTDILKKGRELVAERWTGGTLARGRDENGLLVNINERFELFHVADHPNLCFCSIGACVAAARLLGAKRYVEVEGVVDEAIRRLAAARSNEVFDVTNELSDFEAAEIVINTNDGATDVGEVLPMFDLAIGGNA